MILAKLFPRKTNNIRNTFTIPNYSNRDHFVNHYINKLIRFYLGYKMTKEEQENSGELEQLHKNFWSSTESYFTDYGSRTEGTYIPANKDLIQELTPFLIDNNIQTVCEFGTGDGSWLNYLSQQWEFINEFIGIDISESQIEKNKKTYNHLTFITADLLDWVKINAKQNTFYHTNGGVLEYLSEDSVKHCIDILKNQGKNSVLLFIEPIYGEYDIERDTKSMVIGYEHSYTHNYVHLLKIAGVDVLHYEEKEMMGHRLLVTLAYINGASS